jgi:hypothetical protein
MMKSWVNQPTQKTNHALKVRKKDKTHALPRSITPSIAKPMRESMS